MPTTLPPVGDSTSIEVVVLDCHEGLGGDYGSLVPRLRQVGALGIDVVLVGGGNALALEPHGPGRLFIWSMEVPEVRELRSAGSAPAVATVPGDSPTAWVRRHLVGLAGPDGVAVVTDPAGLDDVVTAQSAFPTMIGDAGWVLEVGGFDPDQEGDVEAWTTVGNGRTGTRGSLEEGRKESSPAILVAGVFGEAEGDSGGPELVTGPEWTRLRPRVGGNDIELDPGSAIEHRRVLDLRQGTLFRRWRQRLDTGGEWVFHSARLASLGDRDVLALVAEAHVDGVGQTAVHLGGELPMPSVEGPVASVEEVGNVGHVAISVRARGGGVASFAVSETEHEGRIERFVGVGRSGSSDPRDAAEGALARSQADGMATAWGRHRRAWRDRWRDADVVVGGDAEAQEALRFALYHLISAADPDSDMASVGARALTGPGYRGHVFWDTEVFVLPFFTWTHPPTARALLAYRYRTLPQARAKAARLGYGGALYPWESADTGEEVTPSSVSLPDGTCLAVLTGAQEHHISADVALACWQYWNVTADHDFLATMGAEIIVETARFWATRAERGADGHHINEVIGCDEYHEGVDDNAYTNAMARWNLEAAAAVCEALAMLDAPAWAELSRRLEVQTPERQQWRAVAASLVEGFHPESSLYEQHAGFFDLEDIRAVDLAPRPFTGELVVGVDRLRHTQVVKQADVVMLSHVLPSVVDADIARANYDYYEPRTCHGSSLSPAVHAAVAARVGRLDQAASYFQAAAGLDLRDDMGNAAKGVHIATMGGLWQAAVLGFGGVQADDGFVRIDPRLPPSWDRLAFPVRWRGARIDVDATADTLRMRLDGPATVAVGGAAPSLLERGSFVASRQEAGWSGLEAEAML
ncbi:MAG: glycosyl hydrolase family 65 protein [Acidimicrobiales bacterium]